MLLAKTFFRRACVFMFGLVLCESSTVPCTAYVQYLRINIIIQLHKSLKRRTLRWWRSFFSLPAYVHKCVFIRIRLCVKRVLRCGSVTGALGLRRISFRNTCPHKTTKKWVCWRACGRVKSTQRTEAAERERESENERARGGFSAS